MSMPTVQIIRETVPESGQPGDRITAVAEEAMSQLNGETPEERAEREAHSIQAASEGVTDVTDHVETVWGKSYKIGSKVGLMPLMRFAAAAKRGMDTSDMEALAAIYDMLKDCIHADEWERFENEATAACADAEDMMPIVGQVIEILSAKPTRRRIASSNGVKKTTPNLTATSSEKAEAMGLVPVDQLLG